MKKALIAATLLGACAVPASLLAQDSAATNPAVGNLVYAMTKVKGPETVGSVFQATDTALMVQIGDKCVGLPRQNFTEVDGRFQSPWTKDALIETMSKGNPEDFVCPDASGQTNAAIGREVYALKEVEQKQTVGTVKQADDTALRIQIGDRCIGLPRQNFTEKDGQFESPWTKEALENTMNQGDPATFACPA